MVSYGSEMEYKCAHSTVGCNEGAKQGGGAVVISISVIDYDNQIFLIYLPSGTCFLMIKLKVFPVQKSPWRSWHTHSAQVKNTVMAENVMQMSLSPILSTNVKFERQA